MPELTHTYYYYYYYYYLPAPIKTTLREHKHPHTHMYARAHTPGEWAHYMVGYPSPLSPLSLYVDTSTHSSGAPPALRLSRARAMIERHIFQSGHVIHD